MARANEIPADRIRKYVGHLTLQARSSLLVEIERMQMYNEDISDFEIILSELRAEFRNSGHPGNRVGNPSRYFFEPIEVLFVDRSPERANSGEISRGSLAPIWEWINQILLPTMAREYCEEIKQVILDNNPHQTKLIAAAFQSKVVKCLEGFLSSSEGIEGARNGLARYTCARGSLEDLRKILSALLVRDAIAAFNGALPSKIDDLKRDSLAKIRRLLDSFSSEHPEAMPFALTMVRKRLKTPWQLVRLATKIAASRSVDDIAATRYAISIPMVLDHLDDKRIELNHALKSNRVQVAKDILIDIYDIEYALRVRIGRIEKSEWGRRLNKLIAAVAADLKTEFQRFPRNTHHVLGSPRLHRHHIGVGTLTSLMRKGQDALTGGATYCRNLIGFTHRLAG